VAFPYPIAPLSLPLWRMLQIRYQRGPLSGEGARLHGGRWNRVGQAALYLARDPGTAVAEFYQGLPKPGTLAPYQLDAGAIADFTDGHGGPRDAAVAAALEAEWKRIAFLDKGTPPGWSLTEAAIAAGAEGALAPSVQNRGGVTLVLWRWHDAGEQGDGAALALIDPMEALRG
jgi:RES domain-containing protein